MVASVLSDNAEPKWTPTLIKLLNDTDDEIARQAAPGLGKIGDKAAREPLLAKLKTSDKDSREKYLDALKDGVGAIGLIMALESTDESSEKMSWYHKKQVFDLVQKLSDPRGGNALFEYIQSKPHIHYQTRAAFTMAEIGDVRAVPTLAKRLRMDPLKIYSDQYDWEMALKRDDNERVVAARMIADLSVLHPDKRESIREQAEDALIFWIHELPSPHANGLRALAAMESTKDIDALRKWANPDSPLPKEGQQPPMPEEWVIAQSALRYAGWMKDERTWPVFEKMLTRKPPELTVTMDGLMAGGLAILGMSLRAVGVGAAHGMSEWGDPKAFQPLIKYIEDPKENEQSRMAACAALAWVSTPDDILTVAKKIQEYSGTEKSDQFRRECLLEALIQRPIEGTAPALMQLMTKEAAIETRHQVARAIAKSGIDKDTEAKLFEMLKDEVLINDAALALILGGSPSVAQRAVAHYADEDRKAALEDLQHLWFNSFGYWSTEDLEKGLLFKYVDNAVAIAQLQLLETQQEWARLMLERQFDNLIFDNGPHSFTRVVLRKRLYDMAKGQDKEKREGSIRTLQFMKEQGVLLALRDEAGETGKLAREAYHLLMNPKIVTGVKIPEAAKGE
jgi:HEAT repeat protein